MAFVSPLSPALLDSALDDATRNLARIRTISATPSNQTTTSTTAAAVYTEQLTLTSIVRAVTGLKTFIQADISNSGANQTNMAISYGGGTSIWSNNIGHSGAVARTSEVSHFPLTHAADVPLTGAVIDEDRIVGLTLVGSVSAGTGTYANITMGVIAVRGA